MEIHEDPGSEKGFKIFSLITDHRIVFCRIPSFYSLCAGTLCYPGIHRHKFGPERDAEGRWNWLPATDREMRGFLPDFEIQTQEISRDYHQRCSCKKQVFKNCMRPPMPDWQILNTTGFVLGCAGRGQHKTACKKKFNIATRQLQSSILSGPFPLITCGTEVRSPKTEQSHRRASHL